MNKRGVEGLCESEGPQEVIILSLNYAKKENPIISFKLHRAMLYICMNKLY